MNRTEMQIGPLMPGPFATGTVSLGIYAGPGSALGILEDLFAQARAASQSGLDGVTVSEHHGGFPTYVPNPLQVAGWLLDRTQRIWAGPCPLLLPLRPPLIVAEELCWLAALHPGRVGVGFAPGYLTSDFELHGVDHEVRGAEFGARLERLAPALSGQAVSPLDGDQAIAACRESPIPFVVAAGSRAAVRRAAGSGGGILTDSLAPSHIVAQLFGEYLDRGGSGPRVVNRRIWIGDPPATLVEQQMNLYREGGSESAWLQDGSIKLVHGPAANVADRLADLCAETGATHLGVKFHAVGVTQAQALEQISALGAVLPVVRDGLAR